MGAQRSNWKEEEGSKVNLKKDEGLNTHMKRRWGLEGELKIMVKGSKAHSKEVRARRRTQNYGWGLEDALEGGEGLKAHLKGCEGLKVH